MDVDGRRLFVKTAIEARAGPSLRRAVALHRAVAHPAIIPLLGTVTTDEGPALVYPWVDGEVLYRGGGRAARLDPEGPHARFRSLPVDDFLAALDAVFEAHLALAAAGFVGVDLYDGCLIYDFAARRVHLCDLDEYRAGPFVVDTDRLPGSTRFMAPEERRRGATVDQRTTVFNLGRTARVHLDTGDLDGEFRGDPAVRAVLDRATRPLAAERYPTVEDFMSAWWRAMR